MNKATKFGLSLLSALVLSACSSNSGNGNDAPKAQMPQANDTPPISQPKQDQQSNLNKKEEKPKTPMPQEESKVQPPMAKEDPKTQQPPTVKEEPKPQQPPMVKEEPKPQQPPMVKEEPKPQQPPMVKEEPKPQQPPMVKEEPETQQPPIVKEEPKTQQPPMVKEEPKTQQPPMVKEESKTPPTVELPKTLTDEDAFKFLNSTASINKESALSIKLDGKELALMPLDENTKIDRKETHLLHDSDGQLVGYYGYARLSHTKQDPYVAEMLNHKNFYVPLLSINKNIETTLPEKTMQYTGKMYYHYLNTPQEALSLDVVAFYSSKEKVVGMTIYDKDGRRNSYKLGGQTADTKVQVITDPDVKDNVVGKLYIDKVYKGEFTGGLYGKHGDILAGEAKSREDQGQDAWKGVVGTKGYPNTIPGL